MLRTLRELFPLVVKAWWVWIVGLVSGAIGLAHNVGWLNVGWNVDIPAGFWPAIFVVALIAALIQAFHKVRLERDAHRPDPQNVGDWPIREAVRYIIDDSQWGVDQAGEGSVLEKVFPQIREAALNGFVTVWGRLPREIFVEDEPRRPIDREYWESYTFDELACIPRNSEEKEKVSTRTRRDGGLDKPNDRIFVDLFLVRVQVTSYWPKALPWQKSKLVAGHLFKSRRPT